MSRRPLSAAQTLALENVRKAEKIRRDTAAEAEMTIRREVEKVKAQVTLNRDLAVRAAVDLDVAKRRVCEEGLGTQDYGTIQKILARTDRLVREAGETPEDAFSWENKELGTVRVRFPDFPTVANADDYAAVLSGIVSRDHTARKGWAVVTDDGDQQTPAGLLPGWLTWEIEDAVEDERESSLTNLLEQWFAENTVTK